MKVKELLADPNKWTKGSSARDSVGIPVHIDSDRATCFCMRGALVKVCGEDENRYSRDYDKLMATILEDTCVRSITYFNDHPSTTHQDILRVLEKADV